MIEPTTPPTSGPFDASSDKSMLGNLLTIKKRKKNPSNIEL